MRVVFMGTPTFAIPSLRALSSAHQVIAVYTQPDRVRGRGREPVATPVKSEALALGIDVRTPETLKDPAEHERFARLEADVACVAAYGLILPAAILESPVYGCVNVHASLLPRHRGAAPVHRAILDGDSVAGVSIMRMEEGLDTGPYATVVEIPVDDHDVESLTSLLAESGARALLETLASLERGTVSWVTQDESRATYAAKITDRDVALDPSLGVQAALRRVRVSGPSARAKIRLCGSNVDILRASPSEQRLPIGAAHMGKDGIVLGFSDGALTAQDVRPEGRGSMSGSAFACGARSGPETTWESA